MNRTTLHTFKKSERLCSKKALDRLFNENHHSFSAYPLRAVYAPDAEEGVRILVSVSKRHFKRAVHRNHVKRQIRESYRLNKSLLVPVNGGLHIAFLWTSNEFFPFTMVQKKMQSLLLRIHESLKPVTQDI